MTKQTLAIFLLVLVASYFAVAEIIQFTAAQTNPAVPEFTLAFVAHPYDVAPVTTIDPYTGQNRTISSGYHSENKSIDVTIRNQAYSASDGNGNRISLLYNFRYKGHYEDTWIFFPVRPGSGESQAYIEATVSNYTIVSLPNQPLSSVLAGGKIDVQVQALIGIYKKIEYDPKYGYSGAFYSFGGKEGDWSSTQTIAIPEPSPSATPSNSPSPTIFTSPLPTQQTQPEQPQTNPLPYVIVAFASVIIGLVAGVLFTKLRYRKSNAK